MPMLALIRNNNHNFIIIMSQKSPIKESFEEISQKWPTMETRQKLGFVAGLTTTISGVILRPMAEIHQGKRPIPTHQELIAGIVLDLRDFADGRIVRATDAVTLLGKLLDPLVDKTDFFIQEFFHYKRGNLSLEDLVLRWGRDAVVTAVRVWAKIETDGNVDISAGWPGKSSTTLRSLSLRSTATKLEHTSRHRRAHQQLATGALISSGVYNIINLRRQVSGYKKTKKAYHQAASHAI